MKAARLSLILALLVTLTCSCQRSPPSNIKLGLPPPLAQDEQWQQNLLEWLDFAYWEENGEAGFVAHDEGDLKEISLVYTVEVLEILRDLKCLPEDSWQIAQWLESCHTEQGFYKRKECPAIDDGERLDFTFYAITGLEILGFPAMDAESTASWIFSFLGDDGLFYFGETPISPEENSDTALELLGKLGYGDDPRLEKTQRVLQQHWLSYLSDSSEVENIAELSMNEKRHFILVVSRLARQDPALIPGSAISLVRQAMEEVPSLTGAMTTVLYLNDLWAAAELLSLPELESERIVRGFRDFLQNKIFPQLEGGAAMLGRPVMDPTVTGWVVELAEELNVTYPDKEALLENISKHRRNGGYIFLRYHLDADFTYWGLELARRVGFDVYEAQKIKRYLKNTFSSGESMDELYFGFLAYKLLEPKIEPGVTDTIRSRAIKLGRQLSMDIFRRDQYGFLALLAMEANFDIPGELKTKMAEMAAQLKEKILVSKDKWWGSTSQMYWLWAMQRSLPDEDIISKREAKEWLLLRYSADHSGFGNLPGDMPDLGNTFYAVELLSQMGNLELVDREKTLESVLSWKQEHDSKDPRVTEATFYDVYQGIALLEQLTS